MKKGIEALHSFSMKIISPRSLDELIEAAIESIMEIVKPDSVMIFVRDGEDLILKGLMPENAIEINQHKIGECLCGIAAKEMRPVYSKNIHEDSRCTMDECKDAGFVSFAAIPLIAGNELMGVLGIASKQERDFERESWFIEVIASELAVAMQNVEFLERIKESEELFRKLFDNTQVGVDIIQDGKFIYVNKKFAEMLGYGVEEIIGQNPERFIHPGDKEVFRKYYRGRLDGKLNHVNYRLRVIRKDGEVRIIDAYGTKIMLKGKPAIAGFSVDITEQEKMREEMFRAKEELEAIFNSIIDPVIVLAPDHTILDVNPATLNLLGKSRNEVIGKKCFELFHKTDEPPDTCPMERLLSSKHHETETMEMEALDGIYLITASPVIKEGKVIKVVHHAKDITELKRYQQHLEKIVEERTRELAESEERYRTLVESPIVAFWEADAEGNFTFVNKRLLEMSGYSEDEVVGKMTMFDPLPEEYREWLAERMRLHKERKLISDVVEAELLRKDGSRFNVLVSPSSVYDEKGNLIKIVGAMIDITDRKRAEERLKNTIKELEKLNEELESYVNAISHDLKAPLRNLMGYVDALLEDYAEKLEGDARFYLERIEKLTEKMDSLINDLVEYSRISRYSFKAERVDVNNVVREAIEYLRDEIDAKQARIEISDIQPVKGDRKLLFTAILNLISNAIKFVEDGVRPEVKIWGEKRDGRIRIYVKDNGIGIPREHHEKVFRIFERLHGEEVYPGTGIGLAIVKKAVEIMGGDYGLESEPGKGSVFWIELERWEDGENSSG